MVSTDLAFTVVSLALLVSFVMAFVLSAMSLVTRSGASAPTPVVLIRWEEYEEDLEALWHEQ